MRLVVSCPVCYWQQDTTRYDKFIKKIVCTSVSLLVKLFYFSVLLLCFLATVTVNKDDYIKIEVLKHCRKNLQPHSLERFLFSK